MQSEDGFGHISIFESNNIYWIEFEGVTRDFENFYKDEEILSEILKSKQPKEMKKLGRKVRNFDENVWKKKRYSIILNGNYAKFLQNDRLRQFLIQSLLYEEQTMLNLVKPDIKYKNQYLEMLDEWKAAGEQPQPWVLQEDCSDFNAMVQKFENLSKGIDVPNGFVPSTTYWAYDDESGKIVGAVNIRHYLNDMLLKVWGNIGYGIRPSERRKGYATTILKLALECCKTLKMERVLLGCYKENIASAKTILKNGGVIENEAIEENSREIVQRYWINTKIDT